MRTKHSFAPFRTWVAPLAALVATSPVLAQTASNVTAVTVEQKSGWDAVKEKLRFQYVGELTGPSIGTGNVPNSDGTASGRINWDNKITAGYRISKNLVTDFTFDFVYNPLGKNLTRIDPSVTPFELRDPNVRLQNTRLIHTDNFNLVGDVRVILPFSQNAQAAGMVAGFRTTQFSSFNLPSSKWSFGHFSYLRFNAYGSPGNGRGAAFSTAFSLHGEYAFTDTLGLYLWSDILDLDLSRASVVSTDSWNAQVGVNWDLTPSISINPFIKVLPGFLSINTTTFNMVLTATLF